MHVLKEQEFINLFDTKTISFKAFTNKAQVQSSKRITPLKQYSRENHIPINDLLKLYYHIQQRNQYLSRFYKKSLDVGSQISIVHPPMAISELNNNTNAQYKNIIRNIYYNEILKTTQSGLENLPSFLTVLENLYIHNIIDYKLLTPSARFYIKEERIGSVFSSFYFRASIMNPYLVYSLNQRVLNGERIFTPTLGWSSYAYGFLECPAVKEYVGVDVIPKVCRNTVAFANKYYPTKQIQTYCTPSEDLLFDSNFMKKYKEHFDVVFFSPPYYRLELYAGNKQSTNRYKTYEDWLAGYWTNTIKLCRHVLQKGGRLCYIISNYGADANKVDLVKDLNQITKSIGFHSKGRIFKMHNKAVAVNVNQNDNHESICVFFTPFII
jgi:hypothetical protein